MLEKPKINISVQPKQTSMEVSKDNTSLSIPTPMTNNKTLRQ